MKTTFKEQATELLREKGLIEKGFGKFIIRFSDREEVDIAELMSEFTSKAMEKNLSRFCQSLKEMEVEDMLQAIDNGAKAN